MGLPHAIHPVQQMQLAQIKAALILSMLSQLEGLLRNLHAGSYTGQGFASDLACMYPLSYNQANAALMEAARAKIGNNRVQEICSKLMARFLSPTIDAVNVDAENLNNGPLRSLHYSAQKFRTETVNVDLRVDTQDALEGKLLRQYYGLFVYEMKMRGIALSLDFFRDGSRTRNIISMRISLNLATAVQVS